MFEMEMLFGFFFFYFMFPSRIESHPSVMLGKPCIKGTRITVELILRKLAEGCSVEDVLERYRGLKREDVLAAMEYAAGVLSGEGFEEEPVINKD